ncbi:MAG: hypothetical protein R6U36_09060 [Candidatus Fermentibacteraceae bacterium]
MLRKALAAAFAVIAAGGCGNAAGPGQGGAYPLTPVGNVDLGAAVTDLDFIGDDVLAASGSRVCFVDGDLAYLLAEVETGSNGLDEVAATPDGGYALAAADSCVYRVSNQTYLLQDSLEVDGEVAELVMHDYAGEVWVLLEDGDILTVDVGEMTVSSSASPGAFDTECALYAADLRSLYRGGDDGVQRLSVPGLSPEYEADLPMEVIDLSLDHVNGYLLAAMENRLRSLSSLGLATQMDYTHGNTVVDVIPGMGVMLAGASQGIWVVDVATGEDLQFLQQYSRPRLLRVNGDGSRCAVVYDSSPSAVEVYGTD